MKYFVPICVLCFFITAPAQVVIFSDDFEDGNMAGWSSSGVNEWSSSDISPISGNYSLKHELSDSTGNSYIYRDLSSLDVSAGTTTWRFSMKNGDWEPSESDKFWVYILLNNADGDGYAVGVNKGEDTDTLRFFRVTDGLMDTVLICSAFRWKSDDTVGVEVQRDRYGTWQLGYDSTGGFDNLDYNSAIFDTTYSNSLFFALSFYFTPLSAGTLWMDDISVMQRSGVRLEAKAFLEGPYNSGGMNTLLRTNGYLPLTQPYNVIPWDYRGAEQVSSIPDDVVDWVLVELRNSSSASTSVDSIAGFLLSDGTIVDTSGNQPLFFPSLDSSNYYIVIHHRNHLPIMSAQAVGLTLQTTLYDFSLSVDQAYGSNAQGLLDTGVYGMYSGDANANGQIQNDDKNSYWQPQSGSSGYQSGDFNLNGQVQNDDKNNYWQSNTGLGSQVPD